jgi:DNA repair protein SbcC/Rad50
MIPARLKMRNFMPYKGDTPELSFTGIHTACISGENGAGKSSIVDAITWVLWGKARAKGDDELVHQNECEMEVEFDFNLGNELYRVIRKHSKPKTHRASGKGSLDLFIFNGASFISVSADNKTQTEHKITQLLHMDYDTFINSAFLRQSHADEFSRQTPARRKEVLASILGLDKYDEYETRAREQAHEAENESQRLQVSIGDMAVELEKKQEIETEFAAADIALKETDSRFAESLARLNTLQTRRQELNAVEAHCQQLGEALLRHAADITVWEAAAAEARGRIAEYRGLTADQPVIEADYLKLLGARTLEDELDGKARRLYQLQERKSQLEREFMKAQADLNAHYRVVEDRTAKLEERSAHLPDLRRDLAAIQPRYKELRDLQTFISNYCVTSKEKMAGLARLGADIDCLKSEIDGIQKKLNLLKAPSDGSRCPLCESDLGEDRMRLVVEKLKKDQTQKRVETLELEKNRLVVTAQINQLNRDLDTAETEYKNKNNSIVSEVARLTEAVKEASGAADQLKTERQALSEIAESLARRDFAGDLLKRLDEVEASIGAVDYDAKKHEAVKVELKGLEHCDARKRALERALEFLPEEIARQGKALKTLEDIRKRQALDIKVRDGLLGKLAALPVLEQDLAKAEAEQREWSGRLRNAQQLRGSLQQRLAHLDELAGKVKEKQKALNAASRKAGLYQELALAFGKKGIQAMLIETTLPEIEDEANRLLSRMTDGRMSVTFETQRDTKKGDIAETLDIKIGDELGTRSYEMFSGGEAFRIDFAIRISLSRLLARRAGAPLPTLIIDEGFGTQDAEGIEKLKEAINSIQDEFKKIIVITHIEELKDAFPTRINVVKTDDGSKIEVNGG